MKGGFHGYVSALSLIHIFMNNVLILLDNLDDWRPYYETSSVLTVSDYLKNKPVEKDRKLVIDVYKRQIYFYQDIDGTSQA